MINLAKMALAKVLSVVAFVGLVSAEALVLAYQPLLKWLVRVTRRAYPSEAGAAELNTILVAIVIIYIGFMLIGQFSNLLGNITSPTNSTVASFFTLGEWLIPVLAIVGLFLYGIQHFTGGGGSKGGGSRRARKKSK